MLDKTKQREILAQMVREDEEIGLYDEPTQLSEGKHRCKAPNESKDYIYGCAIWVCYEDELDELVVENGEYGSQVNYCPYCGYEAKNKIKKS